jgi:hypothetical protein
MESGLKFPKMNFEPAMSQKLASVTLLRAEFTIERDAYSYYGIEVEGTIAPMKNYFTGPDAELLARAAYNGMLGMVTALGIQNVLFVDTL